MPKIVDHQLKREEILDKSFALFAERGFAAVTMREIAAVAGVSTGSIYHYFSTKDDVFVQMYQTLARRNVERATADIPPGASLESRLNILFRYLEENEEHLQRLLMMAVDFNRQREDATSKRFVTQTSAFYRKAIAEQMGADDPGLAAPLYSLVLGLLMQRLFDPKAADFQTHAELVKRIFSAAFV